MNRVRSGRSTRLNQEGERDRFDSIIDLVLHTFAPLVMNQYSNSSFAMWMQAQATVALRPVVATAGLQPH